MISINIGTAGTQQARAINRKNTTDRPSLLRCKGRRAAESCIPFIRFVTAMFVEGIVDLGNITGRSWRAKPVKAGERAPNPDPHPIMIPNMGLSENRVYPNYSHLIGIMIINHWVNGVHYFQTYPTWMIFYDFLLVSRQRLCPCGHTTPGRRASRPFLGKLRGVSCENSSPACAGNLWGFHALTVYICLLIACFKRGLFLLFFAIPHAWHIWHPPGAINKTPLIPCLKDAEPLLHPARQRKARCLAQKTLCIPFWCPKHHPTNMLLHKAHQRNRAIRCVPGKLWNRCSAAAAHLKLGLAGANGFTK